MDKTCKNCIHFKNKSVDYNPPSSVYSGYCDNPKFLVGYGNRFENYEYKAKSGEYHSTVAPDGVLVEGDEGWGFEVGKDFGCIHFKDK